MGIELPPELADVAAQTGVKWPAADEDKMREAAQAWRDTGKKLTTLIGDADTSAQAALHTTQGAGADAARSHWGNNVKPDTGHLTSVVKGCTDAADKLDHAANQVGEAKLAIVRNLVPLAKNKDVAEHAAAAGHPTALLGLDTAIKGTAANVANVHHTLVSAVQPATGVVMDTAQPLVDPNPGAQGHGHNFLKDTVSGVTLGAGNLVQNTGHAATNLVQDTGQGAGHVVHGGANLVQDTSQGAVNLVRDTGHTVHAATDVVQDTVTGPGDHGHGPIQAPPGQVGPGNVGGPGGHHLPGDVLPPAAGGLEPSTGPIAIPGSHDFVLPHDAPTPPSGIPVVHDQSVHVASAAPAVLDAPPPAAQAPVAPVSPGVPGAPVVGGGGGGAPAAPIITGGPAPAAPPPVAAAPVAAQPVSAQPGPAPVQRGQSPTFVPDAPRQQQPVQQQPSPQPAAVVSHTQAPKQDQETILAIWLVRMFPLGHMPVARDRPARQLPPPSQEYDYAPGMRFEPHDHPSSGLIEAVRGTARPVEPEEDAIVDGLAVGYDPLGGQHERDWDRRFVVRAGSGRDTLDIEYAWPPAELYPEGGIAPGEAEILPPGTIIDRFGTEEGRVFAAESTAFSRRSLPPSHLRAGYRRYRVARALPVWKGFSAAWFAQSGGGVRYRTVYPAADLVAFGYLTEEIVDEG
ncbi:TNT domain-containing protein [Actinocrispum sp. NPDC049592]|uniref:TNT domain-containing protein n=1 Tax=Actinocrispum sp. NPDC049592 TaxID=3154835 RepID=UPI00342E0F0E